MRVPPSRNSKSIVAAFFLQGANQALLDGVLLARALHKTDLAHTPACSAVPLAAQARVPEALRKFESDMLVRSAVKVRQSREAAASLHSPTAMAPSSCTRAAAARGDAKDCVTADDFVWAQRLVTGFINGQRSSVVDDRPQ